MGLGIDEGFKDYGSAEASVQAAPVATETAAEEATETAVEGEA